MRVDEAAGANRFMRESEKPKELVEAEKIVERGQRRNRYQEKVEEQTFWKERVGSDFNDLFGGDFGDGAGGGFDPNNVVFGAAGEEATNGGGRGGVFSERTGGKVERREIGVGTAKTAKTI